MHEVPQRSGQDASGAVRPDDTVNPDAPRMGDAFHRRLIAALPETIVKTDLQGRIMYTSPRAAENQGVRDESMFIGMDCLQFLDPRDRERAGLAMQETLERQRLPWTRYRFLRLDGSTFIGELTASVVTDACGKPEGFVAIIRYMTGADDRPGESQCDSGAGGHDRSASNAPPSDCLLGSDHKMRSLRELVRTVAPTTATVLVQGETGTGKDLVAHALHDAGPRHARPFVKVDCGVLAESLLESELFGHEAAAFTGADRRRIGRFELAHGGTVFLDEINNTSNALQAKLLRVVEEGRFERVGGTETISVDVRVIAASNRMLESCVESGSFRRDLYYRLNVVSVHVPPLRRRPGDIPLLAEHFLDLYSSRHGVRRPQLSENAIAHLCAYRWPGNVRQLEHCIEQAVVLCGSDAIEPADLRLVGESSTDMKTPGSYAAALRHAGRAAVENALKLTNNNRTRAAEILGLSRSALYAKLRDYGLDQQRM